MLLKVVHQNISHSQREYSIPPGIWGFGLKQSDRRTKIFNSLNSYLELPWMFCSLCYHISVLRIQDKFFHKSSGEVDPLERHSIPIILTPFYH